MADDRRIITGTHVVAKEGSLLEGGLEANRKWKMDDTVGKTLGGKSIVDITTTQNWSGGDYSGWYRGDNKSTELSVLGVTKADTTDGTEAMKFLYVRNLDATVDCLVSLTVETTWEGTFATATDWDTPTAVAKTPSYDQRWDEGMYIIVPPGGSVQLRGNANNIPDLRHVHFRSGTPGSTINIEYVLAE
jgi:hypothetical protein